MATKQSIEFGKLFSEKFTSPILEIGSKIYDEYEQYSPKNISDKIGSYVGIDISDGEGVDLVVDFSEIDVVQKLGWVNKFNTIHCHCVLEHVPDIFTFSKNIQEALNVSGTLYLTVPFSWKIHRMPVDMWRFTPQGIDYLFTDITFNSRECAFSTRKKKTFYPIDTIPELNLGSELENNGKIFSYTIKILRKMGLDKGYFKERALLFESNLMMIGVKSDKENYSIYKK